MKRAGSIVSGRLHVGHGPLEPCTPLCGAYARQAGRRAARRMIEASTFLVAFGLGTLAGLVLSSLP